MLNLLWSLLVAAAVLAVLVGYAGWGPAIALGLIVGGAAFLLLNRRVSRKIAAVVPQIERHLARGRVDRALELLREQRRLGRHQFVLGRALDAQIGMLLYAHAQDYEAARPYLERAPRGNWRAALMLGAQHARARDHRAAERVLERTVKRHPKVGLAWSVYAWYLLRRGRRQAALELLARGRDRAPDDRALARNLRAARKHKRLPMHAYGDAWWALHLERPIQRARVAA